MKCPHCSVTIHSNAIAYGNLLFEGLTGYKIDYQLCPACKRLILELVFGPTTKANRSSWLTESASQRRFIHPPSSIRTAPLEVPAGLAKDYQEAATVLIHSPKASAALSRRILQAIIRDHAGIKKRDLFEEIQSLIDEEKVPTYITDELDAIRHIGNWAAHPKRYTITGEIVEVEPNEAEACLDAIDGLFDFYFVQPKKASQRREALQQKIAAQKKSP